MWTVWVMSVALYCSVSLLASNGKEQLLPLCILLKIYVILLGACYMIGYTLYTYTEIYVGLGIMHSKEYDTSFF